MKKYLHQLACLPMFLLFAVVLFTFMTGYAYAEEDSMSNDVIASSLQYGDSIYVNGETGDDSNDGTEEFPVKSFSKAKELMETNDSDIIWVTGTLQVKGVSETWDLGGKSLMRDVLFRGELVHISEGANLTLSNIVIDGSCKSGATGVASVGDGSGGSLIGVFGTRDQKSSLTIGNGAKLQNNAIRSQGKWMPESGGAIYVSNGNINVEGGTISGNSAVYGGGICAVYSSVVNITSGTITGNSAVKGTANHTRGYSGTGGGICAWRGAAVNFSGGTISDNTAFNRGGGISMGTIDTFDDPSSVLTMTNGSLIDNKAGCVGGGLFVQAGYSEEGGSGTPSYCVARITGGTIAGNSTTDTGDSNSDFGGGGIYVNGYSSTYSALHNGELYLSNVEISGNKASIAGGGYAGCPVSFTYVFMSDGSICYGNSTESGFAREVYVLASNAFGSHSGNPLYEISPSMLGGGAYRWTYDDGSEVPLNKLKGELNALMNEELSLNNTLTAQDGDVQKALSLVQVNITNNNSATRGGGIGSNGSIFIGKSTSTETCEVHATKKWIDANDKDELRPSSIVIELYRDNEYVGFQTVTPNDDGSWDVVFSNLPKADLAGNNYSYSVKERNTEGYVSSVEASAENDFIVTNVRSTSVSVSKKWNDSNNADESRPASVSINLLADGVKVAEASVEPDENDNWNYVFENLAKYDESDGHEIAYTVEESPIEGYMSVIEGDATSGFIVTNTKKEIPPADNDNPKPPADDDSNSKSETSKQITALSKSESSEQATVLPDTGDHQVIPAFVGVLIAALAAIEVSRRLSKQ